MLLERKELSRSGTDGRHQQC